VSPHTLRNEHGLVVRFIGRGARITEVHAPDRDGNLADIALGLSHPADYANDRLFLGAIVGRCANRLANGAFPVGDETIRLPVNDPPHHIHGGEVGFDAHEWDATEPDDPRGPAVAFVRTSPAGESGYPGTLSATVTYTLSHDNELIVEMLATSDAPTLCNLVQHVYWNLAGHDPAPSPATVDEHEVQVFADEYTPAAHDGIPTGEHAPVAGTPLDFREPKPIGRDVDAVGTTPRGYDHNMVIRGEPLTLRPVARVRHPGSGRVLEMSADQPGAQLYTGGYLSGDMPGKAGAKYPAGSGLCIESQRFPDAANQPHWVTPVLLPGETYRHTIVYRFTNDA